jgi:hypothetical protein
MNVGDSVRHSYLRPPFTPLRHTRTQKLVNRAPAASKRRYILRAAALTITQDGPKEEGEGEGDGKDGSSIDPVATLLSHKERR